MDIKIGPTLGELNADPMLETWSTYVVPNFSTSDYSTYTGFLILLGDSTLKTDEIFRFRGTVGRLFSY